MKNLTTSTKSLIVFIILVLLGLFLAIYPKMVMTDKQDSATEVFDSIVAMQAPQTLTSLRTFNRVDVYASKHSRVDYALCKTTIRTLYNDTKEQFVFMIEVKPNFAAHADIASFINTAGSTAFTNQRMVVVCDLAECNVNLWNGDLSFIGTNAEEGIVSLRLKEDGTMKMQVFYLAGNTIPELIPIQYTFYNDD